MTTLGAAALRAIAADVFDDAFRPPPRMTVSEWADEHRMLSNTSAEKGKFRTARIPYLRRIMDVLGDERVAEVTFAKSAQVAGSTAAENFIGYLIDQAPCPILEVWPTEKALRAWSTTRLDPMLHDSPVLAAKFPTSKRRDKDDSIAKKVFPGGYIQALTAKSTTDLRGHSAPVGIAEEIDEWEGDIGGQGDALELLRARMRTFWNKKLFKISTPTIKGHSRIWRELEASSWEEYWVPCPHCHHKQTLRWRDGDDGADAAGAYRLVWDKDDEGEPIPGTCCYVCEGCGVLIEEKYKAWMLDEANGAEWIARYPNRTRHVGLHINTLYSPLCPWIDVATAFRRALKDHGSMISFVNTFLGLPFEESGERVDAHFLAERAEDFGGVVPDGVGLLTLGVDVGGDRLDAVLVGWGRREEAWVLDWLQVHGDPGQDAVWEELDAVLLRKWPTAAGGTLVLEAAAIDTGYQTERVHRFTTPRLTRKGQRVLPVKGLPGAGRALVAAPGKTFAKRARREQRPYYAVGTDTAKDLLASRLALRPPDDPSQPMPAGYVHFSTALDSAFYEQLTAERRVTRYVKGRPVRMWEKDPGKRNEALDCVNYATAALGALGGRVIAELGTKADRARAHAEAPATVPAPAPKRPPRRGNWATRR